jgi:hypothetical protein
MHNPTINFKSSFFSVFSAVLLKPGFQMTCISVQMVYGTFLPVWGNTGTFLIAVHFITATSEHIKRRNVTGLFEAIFGRSPFSVSFTQTMRVLEAIQRRGLYACGTHTSFVLTTPSVLHETW